MLEDFSTWHNQRDLGKMTKPRENGRVIVTLTVSVKFNLSEIGKGSEDSERFGAQRPITSPSARPQIDTVSQSLKHLTHYIFFECHCAPREVPDLCFGSGG